MKPCVFALEFAKTGVFAESYKEGQVRLCLVCCVVWLLVRSDVISSYSTFFFNVKRSQLFNGTLSQSARHPMRRQSQFTFGTTHAHTPHTHTHTHTHTH